MTALRGHLSQPIAYATGSLPRLNLSSTTDASGNYRRIVPREQLVPGADTLFEVDQRRSRF